MEKGGTAVAVAAMMAYGELPFGETGLG
jgi:hypothetical protein